jgi:TonB family protein
MTDFPELMTGHTGSAERRIRARHRMRGLAYVELGENNGGIVLNIGEGGFAVRAAEPISEEGLSCLRFRMPHASQPLEMSGKTAWTSDSRKEAGVQFINLRDDALLEIRAWIFQEVSPENFPRHSRVAHHSRKEMPRRNESILDELLSDESAQAETPDDGDDSTAGRSVIPSPKSTVPDPKTPKAMTPEKERYGAILFAEESSTSPSARLLGTSSRGIKKSEAVLPVQVPGKAVDNWTDFRIQMGKGWVAAALVTLLVAISFSGGMAVRRGGLIGLWRDADTSPSSGAQTQNAVSVAPPAEILSKPLQIEIVDSSNRRWTIPASAGAVRSGGNPAGMENAGISPDASESKNISIPASQTPQRPDDGKTAPVPGPTGPTPILLSLPEHSVSASGSVAISSQRSFQVPAESLQRTSQAEKNLQVGPLANLVDPVYPPDAQQKHVEGTVKLHATIGIDGLVKDLQPLSGPPSLVPAALAAVRAWRYNPTLLNGQPIETQEDISLVFRLPN